MSDQPSPSAQPSQRIQLTNIQLAAALIVFAVIFLLLPQLFVISIQPRFRLQSKTPAANAVIETSNIDVSALQAAVLPQEGVRLPITWNDLGRKMINDGVIDEQKFRALFSGVLPEQDERMLTDAVSEPILMTNENNRFLLDILWAFGLANKNDILENGEMMDKQYGGAGNFASTGGWTLSRGESMNHYSRHAYLHLTPEQQDLVDRVSRTIFRPCCGNSTHFPDCNHGMAMLALLELMAANNVQEGEMYRVALQVNAYWFPQTYLDLATYFKEQGTDWSRLDPKVVLSAEYSSSQGYQNTRQKIRSLPQVETGGGGCGA